MSEYKRFVSYIYAYDRGIKNKNVGFAKVEARNGQCKLVVNVKGAYGGNGKEQEVYLFHREQEKLYGTYIGSFRIENGMGDFRELTLSDDIKHSGLGLSAMGGIIIQSKDAAGTIYASGWDDHTLKVENFIPSGHVWQSEPKTEAIKEAVMEIAAEITPDVMTPEAEQTEPVLIDEFPVHYVSLYEDKTAAEEVPFEESTWKEHKVLPESIQPDEESEEELKEEQERKEDTMHEEETMESPLKEQAQHMTRMADWTEVEEPILQAAEVTLCSGLWDSLYHQFPKVRAFEEERDILCLKIDLKDLDKLPKENWVLGNNSFLLHGYYNFRYLLLAKLSKDEIIIGVPGMFHQKERFMAAMFGFEYFKPTKPCTQMTGQFGYWYRKVIV